MKRKLMAMALSAAMCVSVLAGCGNAASDAPGTAQTDEAVAQESISAVNENEQTTEAAESEVVDSISIESKDITSLDPWDTKSDGKNALWEIYEMLFEVNGFGGEMFPMLADADKGEFGGYDHEAGTGDYTVYLNEGIKDSAGNEIKASDVAFSFDSTYAAGQTSGWNAYEPGCVEVVDDNTVIFHFTKELDQMGELENIWARCFIVSEKAFNDSPSELVSDACGSGPYKLVSYTPGSSVVIEARDDYWQTDESKRTAFQQANVKTITYKVVTEATQFVVGLENGDIDMVEDTMTADLLTDFKDGGSYADSFNVYQFKDNLSYFMAPNLSSDSPMSDINLRLAAFYAIDTNGLVQAYGGDGVAAVTNTLGSNVFGDYLEKWDSDDNYQTTANVELAKEYLAKSNYNGETIRILTISSESYNKICQVILNMLKNVGINAEIDAYDYGTMTALYADSKEWDLYIQQMAASDYLVNVWSHQFDTSNSGTGLTTTFINDPEWQEMLNTVKTMDTHTDENLDAWWQHAVENAYVMGLMVEYKNIVYPEWMETLLFTDKNHIVPGGCTYTSK